MSINLLCSKLFFWIRGFMFGSGNDPAPENLYPMPMARFLLNSSQALVGPHVGGPI